MQRTSRVWTDQGWQDWPNPIDNGDAGPSNVVWRPGMVPAIQGNVFANWADVVACVAKTQGDVVITLDASNVLPGGATIPAGAWDLRPAGISGEVEIHNATKTSFGPFITTANAAVSIHGLSGLQDVQLVNRSTIDLMTIDATNNLNFYFRGAASILQSVLATAAAIKIAGGSSQLFLQDFAFISTLDGGSNAIQVTGGTTLINVLGGSAIDVNMMSRTGGSVSVFSSSATWDFAGGFNALGAQASVAAWAQLQGFSFHGQTTLVNGVSPVIRTIINATSSIEPAIRTPNGDAATVKYGALSADRVNGGPGGGSVGSFRIKALTAVGGGDVNVADQSIVDFWVHG